MLDVNKLTTTASLDGLIRIAITPVISSCKGIQINNMLFLKIMITSCLYLWDFNFTTINMTTLGVFVFTTLAFPYYNRIQT